MCVDSTSFLLMEKHLVTGTTMPSCFYISVGAKTAHKQNSDAHSREIIDLCNPGFWFPAVGTHVRLFRHTSSSKKQGEARWSLVRMCDCFFFCDLKDIPGHRMSRIPATRSADECFLQSELDTKFCPHHRKQGWICIGPYNDRAGMCRPQLPQQVKVSLFVSMTSDTSTWPLLFPLGTSEKVDDAHIGLACLPPTCCCSQIGVTCTQCVNLLKVRSPSHVVHGGWWEWIFVCCRS